PVAEFRLAALEAPAGRLGVVKPGVPDTVDQLAMGHGLYLVMPGLDPGIHQEKTFVRWMRGSSPRMTISAQWTSWRPNARSPSPLMTDLSYTILTEKPEDAAAIERLHERTFGPGRFVRTSERIRERMPHRLDLSYTARIGTLLVGSVRLTPVRIGDTPALL